MRGRACRTFSMTGRSKGPERAALGVRAHSGWAAYVVLGGDPDSPDILLRGRMELCEPAIKGSQQPFHWAEPMAFASGSAYIKRCEKATAALADAELAKLETDLGPLSACAILTASGRPLPDLRTILASHALIHAAEGEFYRDAVAAACARKRIACERIRERDIAAAAHRLPGNDTSRKSLLDAFGKKVGTPWRQDEKLSALAAWLALASEPSRKPANAP